MKKVLVTGASGQLGLTLQERQHNYTDYIFVFKSKEELDITDKKSIAKTFQRHKLDYCINCAAYTNVEQAEKTPEIAFKINAEGVKNLAEVCKENGTVLVHISTDYVFDGKKETPYTVEDFPNPINEYGKSKLKGEQYIQEIMDDYFIVRTSWLYHKEFGHNFYKTMLKKAEAGETLNVTDEQTGCPTDANNLAEFIVKDLILNKNQNYEIHHFTDGQSMSWYQFAKQILKNNKLEKTTITVKNDNYRSFAKRPKYSVLHS